MQVLKLRLPHQGTIPGARGHKKISVPTGTEVYCIVHSGRFYWCAYLDEAAAQECMTNLLAQTHEQARRHIPLATLLAWNFHFTIPQRIARRK